MPRLPPEIDRDPIALVLGAVAVALALAYLAACLCGARARLRAGLIGAAAVALVLAPTLAFVAMGTVTGRPYGQDGGVVQLPLAMDRILSGQSPYGADYSASILGRQARVSDFWSERGGNPILRHHAYLPGTHLLMAPAYLAGRVAGFFDSRMVTLLALALAAWLATRLVTGAERRLAAAAIVLLNPLLYWQQVFGANDVVIVALLLLAVLLGERERPHAAAAVLGLACATKQLAWPFAPFLLLYLSGLRTWADLVTPLGVRRALVPVAIVVLVFAAVVLPVAALDFRAFWADIVVYNVGLPGGENYPLGGTPGFGFANLLIYGGAVGSLRDHVSFTSFYLLLIPVGVLLAHAQMKAGTAAAALLHGGTALLLSLYFSRVVHPNYLVLAATLLPIAVLMRSRVAADVVVVPLLLLAVAVEVAQGAVMRSTWEDAVAVRLPANLDGMWDALMPRAGAELTLDPLGLLWSAVAAGLAIAMLTAGVLGAGERTRLAIVGIAVLAVVVVPSAVGMRVASASGVYRVQDAWALGLRSTSVPGAVREAWSTSFRRDPPADVERDGFSVGLLREPRRLTLMALLVVAGLVAASVARAFRPLALGVALLAPPFAVGTVFGSGAVATLAAALGAWWLALRGRLMLANVAAAAAVLLAAFAFVDRGPGVGWTNVALYFGVTGLGWIATLAVTLLVGAVGDYARRSRALREVPDRRPWLMAGACVLLAILWIVPGASPNDLGVPLALAALAVVPFRNGGVNGSNGRR